MLGLEGGQGYSLMVTHNYRTRTDAFLRRAQHATKDTPEQGRLASAAMSGFGILKVEWPKKKSSEKRINHTISPLSLVYDTKWCHDNAPLVTRRKCSSTTEYFFFFFQIHCCAPRGTEPHVALREHVHANWNKYMNMGGS